MKTFTRSAALLIVLLASCGGKSTTAADEQETLTAEELEVIFEADSVTYHSADEQVTLAEADSVVYYLYTYPFDEDSHAEDNILELQFRAGAVSDGFFWGTSDEFFEAREGFLPCFFVLPLKDVMQDGERLSFMLDSRQMTYLSEPVSVDFHSVDEALQNGGQPWEQCHKFFQDTARYNATFTPDGLIVHKDKSQFPYLDDHNFIKTRKEAIKDRR